MRNPRPMQLSVRRCYVAQGSETRAERDRRVAGRLRFAQTLIGPFAPSEMNDLAIDPESCLRRRCALRD